MMTAFCNRIFRSDSMLVPLIFTLNTDYLLHLNKRKKMMTVPTSSLLQFPKATNCEDKSLTCGCV